MTLLVRPWPFNMIDHKDINRTMCRFELESELLLKCRKQRGAIRINVCGRCTERYVNRSVWCPRQLKVKQSAQPRPINNVAGGDMNTWTGAWSTTRTAVASNRFV